MSNSIYLPDPEDTQMTITVGKGPTVTADAFDLDDMFSKGNTIAKETGRTWKEEFIPLFNKKYGVVLNVGQVMMLWNNLVDVIEDVKKKSSQDS